MLHATDVSGNEEGISACASIAYTSLAPGKTQAGIVLGTGAFPLTPGTFQAQHGQVPRDMVAVESYGVELVPQTVNVLDARALSTPPTLDSLGMELVFSPLPNDCPPACLHTSAVNSPEIAAYYACTEEAVKKATGANAAVAFCHAVRSPKPAANCQGAEAGYASYAHTDQSESSWSSRAHELVAAGDFCAFPPGISEHTARRITGARRYAVVSAWRKLNDSPTTSHLAVLDHTTLQPNDVMPFSIIEHGCAGGNYRLRHSPEVAARHKWLYYSSMTTSEVLLFSAFDSHHPANASLFASNKMSASCFHSAFVDTKRALPTDPARISIDVRCLVIWDDVDTN